MSLGSRSRRTGFWLLDGVKSGSVRRHRHDIRAKMSGGHADENVLAGILDHATRTTPFYQPYAGQDLKAFPVVLKTAYLDDYDDFQSSTHAGQHLHKKTSSGSTGTPFSAGQDPGKRQRAIADMIYFNEVAGQRVGDRLLWLRTWRVEPISRSRRLKQNIVPIDIVGLDDGLKEVIIETLRRDHINGILAFSSTLWALTRFIEDRGYDPGEFGTNVIISTAEALQPSIKPRIEAAFGCPVVDRYANEENGVLACTMPGDDLFRLNHASYRFEFLKLDSDEPEVAGNLARVVVTDLYNHAMPMIRYDTADLAIVASDDQGEAIALRSIEGRRADVIYDTSGHQLSGPSVSGTIATWFPGVGQYQMVQEGATTFHLLVVLGGADHSENEFIVELQKLLGSDAQVTVEFVQSIPSQPNQKFRPVICHYVPGASQPQGAA